MRPLPYLHASFEELGPSLAESRGLRTGCPRADRRPSGAEWDAVWATARECRQARLVEARRNNDTRSEVTALIELVNLPGSASNEVSLWREQALQAAQAKHDACLASFVLITGGRATSLHERADAAARAVELATNGGCQVELAWALYSRAATLPRDENGARPIALMEEAAVLASRIEAVRLHLLALHALAQWHTETKNPRAIELRHEIVRHFRARGLAERAWMATWNLGLTLVHLGDAAGGLPLLEQYLDYAKRESRPFGWEPAVVDAVREGRVVGGSWYGAETTPSPGDDRDGD